MKRRDVLRGAAGALAAGSALGGIAACAREQQGPAVVTKKRIRWRCASSFPRSLDTLFGGAEVLAERLEALSGGRFTLRVHPAGELVPGLQVLDAVQQGTCEVGQSASYYYTGKNPALAFDACVPFGLSARQQTAWLLEGGGLELMRELFADFNVVNFPAGNTGAQMGGWFKREVGSVADLKGLKMRIPGLGGEVMSRLGVTVQVLAGGDIYPALERGAIDATEWVGPYDDEKLGFHKVAKLYYYPGWWEPGPNLSFYVHKPAWEALSSEDRAMFEAASLQAAQVMQARYDVRNPPALRRLLAAGVQLRPFAPDILAAAREEATAVLEEKAAADAGYRKVYEAWKKARDAAWDWWSTAELAYARAAWGTRNPAGG